MITRSTAVKNFLTASTHKDLASLYNSAMEVQVNVSQDGGERESTEGFRGRTWHSYTDGIQKWYGFRVPKNAATEPEDNDLDINFDLAEHAEGIGMTGWDWKSRVSKHFGFDFDAISGHSSGLTEEELKEVKEQAYKVPWITVRRSTSGNGLHLYIFVDNIPTANHTEHAALGRAILGKLSAEAGFDFSSKVDVSGGNLWVWHRKMTKANCGLELIKQGEVLKNIPINWEDHVDVIKNKRRRAKARYVKNETNFDSEISQRAYVKLDEDHKKLLKYLEENDCQWWFDADRNMLVAHTFDLKSAHKDLGLRGIFDTLATGKDKPDHNCFSFAQERPSGAWAVRRYENVQETSNWNQDANGYTTCYYNQDPTLEVASRTHGGGEDEKGAFHFNYAKDAVDAAKDLGVRFKIPDWATNRPAQLKQHKDGRLITYIKRESQDQPIEGWLEDKNQWKKIFNASLTQQTEPKALDYDGIVRHLITPDGHDFGWVLKSNNWNVECYTNVRLALKSLGLSDHEISQTLGDCVLEGWQVINEPFQPEFPGGRKWNRNAAQFRYTPKLEPPFKFPTWECILNHCGKGLDSAIADDGWCQIHNVKTGADYLKIWVASLFQYPKKRLPYIFLYSKDERTGKTTFHEAIGSLLTKGYTRADTALISSANFNGELENAILCAVEETDLGKSSSARNRIKDWITASTIMIHHKGQTPYQVENTTHIIQTGNNHTECPIFSGDTRITMIQVPAFELAEMIPTDQMKIQLEREAPAFMAELLQVEIPPSGDRLNVPVIDTDIKTQTSETNKSTLELFLEEMTFWAPGEKIRYSDLYNHFLEWVDPTEVHTYSKIKFGREIPIKYPKGRVMTEGAQFYIGNISLTEPKNINQDKLILKNGNLI